MSTPTNTQNKDQQAAASATTTTEATTATATTTTTKHHHGYDDEKKSEFSYTAAHLFIDCLVDEGVDIVFGLPGEENADFVMALSKCKKIRFILVRHEQGAAFMADAYGRLTGKPGVCFGTLGPGATNLVTGVADGNMDHAPMVVITGQADTHRLHKESHQNMDVIGMFKPITKWNTTIYHPDVIPEVIRKAFKLAVGEKPGACHLELPEDVAALNAKGLSPLTHLQKVRRAVPDEKVMDQLWQLLRNAKKPVILAGNGAVRRPATKMLDQFCQTTKIPVVNTFMAKGVVSRQNDYCLFTVGLASGDFNNVILEQADLVLSIGFDFVEYHPRLWNPKGTVPIAHIDPLPCETDRYYTPVVEVIGEIAHTLWMLNERLAKDTFSVDTSYYSTVRQRMLDDFATHKDDTTQNTVRPQKILWDVRAVLGPNDILLSDVGAHKMWISRYYQCDMPNTCLISNGFCSMGFALPGAIGAKLAFPDSRVLAICGDGGFLMNNQEMETAKRVGAKIVVMVWCDGGYGLITWKQDNKFGEHVDLSFENPNFELLAKAFGWHGWHINHAADVLPSLQKAFELDGPVLLSVNVDYGENPKLTKRLGKIRTQES